LAEKCLPIKNQIAKQRLIIVHMYNSLVKCFFGHHSAAQVLCGTDSNPSRKSKRVMANIDTISGQGILAADEEVMPNTLNLSWTDEPLEEKELQIESSKLRDAILEGYQDAIGGRTSEFNGNLRSLLKKVKK
jgi:hypothetical protein